MNRILKVVMILIAIGLSFLPYSLAELDHCWNLNADATDSVGSNDGNVSGAIINATTCKIGNCYQFDGSNDFIDFESLGAYPQWTINLWAFPKVLGTFRNILQTNLTGNDCGIRLEGDASNRLTFSMDNDCSYTGTTGNYLSSGQFTAGNWYHLVMTYDGTKLVAYSNGAVKINTTWDNTGTFPDFEIGGARPLGRYWYGNLDEVKFYDAALTYNEVVAEYNSGNGVACTEPSVPSLVVNTDMVNESNIGHDTATEKVVYNGTITASNYLWNCTLLDNNTVINQSLNVNLSINQNFNVSFGEVEKDFLLKIDCNNSDTQDSSSIYRYRVDRVIPLIESTLVNNSNYTQDDTVSWAWNCTDTNLLAMNSTFKDVNGNSVFNRFNNATANSIFMTNSSSYILTSATTYTYELTCWDSHTARQVRPIQWYFQDGVINVEGIIINASMKELDGQGRQATYFYLDPLVSDRYKLKVTFQETSKTQSFTLSGSDLVYLPNSKYKGHFIYKMERWLDFQGNNIESVDVKGNNPYQVTVTLIEESDEIEFESIGDLNRVDSVWNINVLSEEEMQTDYLQQINANIVLIYGVLKMIPIVMLYAVFMVLGYWMIQSGNTISGWMLYVVSFGFDFFFAGQIKEQYLSNTPGFTGTMSFIFVIFLFIWVLAKGTSILYLQRKVKITG